MPASVDRFVLDEKLDWGVMLTCSHGDFLHYTDHISLCRIDDFMATRKVEIGINAWQVQRRKKYVRLEDMNAQMESSECNSESRGGRGSCKACAAWIGGNV